MGCLPSAHLPGDEPAAGCRELAHAGAAVGCHELLCDDEVQGGVAYPRQVDAAAAGRSRHRKR